MNNNRKVDRVPLWLSRLLQYTTLFISIGFLAIFIYWQFFDNPHVYVKYSAPHFRAGKTISSLRDVLQVKSGDSVYTFREICSNRIISVIGHRSFVSQSLMVDLGQINNIGFIPTVTAILPTVSTVFFAGCTKSAYLVNVPSLLAGEYTFKAYITFTTNPLSSGLVKLPDITTTILKLPDITVEVKND